MYVYYYILTGNIQPSIDLLIMIVVAFQSGQGAVSMVHIISYSLFTIKRRTDTYESIASLWESIALIISIEFYGYNYIPTMLYKNYNYCNIT